MNTKPETPNRRPLDSGPRFVRRAKFALAAGAVLGFVALAAAQMPEQILKSFGNPSQSGSQPVAVLVGADGMLYGTTSAGGLYGNGTVFRANADGSGYAVLHAFGSVTNDGVTPQAGLVQGRDGRLYGTTTLGGLNSAGTVFRLATDGSGYTTLRSFGALYSSDGTSPVALIQGADGALYGITQSGGTNYGGTVYSIATDGSAYEVLYNFGVEDPVSFLNTDGYSPITLIQGADDLLYGVTQFGGTNGVGDVFRLHTDGSAYTVLHTFGSFTNDGATPVGLAQDSNGLLVGAAQSGGSYSNGVTFLLHPDGSRYVLTHEFSGTLGDGATPGAGLFRGADGAWYGSTLHGGSDDGLNGDGIVFRMSADGTGYEVLHRFTFINSIFYDLFSTDGQEPGALTQAANGVLYGVTPYGGTTGDGLYQGTGAGTLFVITTNASSYGVVCNFSATGGDGESPCGGIIVGRDGALYGVTSSGGPAGHGCVFKMGASGAGYQILYGFGLEPIDGLRPQAGLMQGTDGLLYGSTAQGGYEGGSGGGIVFKLDLDGSDYTDVLSFGFYAAAGEDPTAAPLQGRDGNLYGTTYSGGENFLGIVYTVGTNGLGFTALHEFSTNGLEGSNPAGGLIQGSDGMLYGTTTFNGTNNGGTVFKLSTNGSGFQVLHTFQSPFAYEPTDGGRPMAPLILGADGFLYGTTEYGGTNGWGTVFKMSVTGSGYQVIHHFGSAPNDGQGPAAPLIQGSDGCLYGTTPNGGYPYNGAGNGTVFKLDTNGLNYIVLYSFGGAANDGQSPQGGLVQGSDGAFYGVTSAGGTMNAGTVFRLGSPPFKFTSFSRLSDQTVSLSLAGSPNSTCRIDASTNLVNWVPLATLADTNGSVQYLDTAAPRFSCRFYRAFQGP